MKTINKYLNFTKIAFKQTMQQRGEILARVGFYGLILLVFSSLWKVVGRELPPEFGPRDMLWYLAMTEWIVLSVPLVHAEIQEDVKSGNLAYFLSRPVSYGGAKFFEAMGKYLARLLLMAGGGVGFALIFSGGWPAHPQSLLLFIPLAILAGAVLLLFGCIIGLASFLIQDSTPLYWVWGKLLFILGGMMLPLDIYPHWLRRLADFTPFTSLLYYPVRSSLSLDGPMLALTLGKLLFWFLAAGLLLHWSLAQAQKHLEINGG